MKLTRTVLLEKHITFGYYNSPDKVPEFLWDQAHFVLSQDGVTPIELFTAYAKYVLIPLAKMNHPIISGPAYNDVNLRLSFYLSDNFKNLAFEVWFDDLVEARTKGLEYLKDFTISIWDKKKFFN